MGLGSFLIPPEGGFREGAGRSGCQVTYLCGDLPAADVPHGPSGSVVNSWRSKRRMGGRGEGKWRKRPTDHVATFHSSGP